MQTEMESARSQISIPEPLAKISKQAAARVKFRIKGSSTEGHLYQGQHLVKPCRNCPGTKAKHPPIIPAASSGLF